MTTEVTKRASARIAPGSLRQLGLPAYAMSRVAGKVTGTRPPAIFTILGRAKGLYWGWLHFAGRLMPFGSLPRRESELAILRGVGTAAGPPRRA